MEFQKRKTMNKTDLQFKRDIDSIMNNEESGMNDIQQEWNTMPAEEHLHKYARYDADKAFEKFRTKTYPKKNSLRRLWWRYAGMAASIVAVCAIGAYMYISRSEAVSLVEAVADIPAVNDSLPRIVLADGKVINMTEDMAVNGMQATVNGCNIVLEENKDGGRTEMEEIIIPRGRMYKLTLFDGSHVLLNSESSIRFPNRFTGTRTVEVKGQAFFEVEKDGRPFNVITPHGTIAVLGTTFSVNAYEDKAFSVALSTGRIEFSNAHDTKVINPGQVITCDAEGKTTISSRDFHKHTAWMEGLIYFENASLEEIMNDIARMYDVRVHYLSEDMKHISFTGECSRFNTVGEFMNLLGMTEDFIFTIEGKDIFIKNKK